MTNDKQLSPAAQAVLDATNAAYDDAATVREGTAATLRELVFQLQYYNCLEVVDMILDARAILDVADELEGK